MELDCGRSGEDGDMKRRGEENGADEKAIFRRLNLNLTSEVNSF